MMLQRVVTATGKAVHLSEDTKAEFSDGLPREVVGWAGYTFCKYTVKHPAGWLGNYQWDREDTRPVNCRRCRSLAMNRIEIIRRTVEGEM